MKVLDLKCGQQHVFEGWFGSEADFLDQTARGLVECPVCGNASITKGLSAPRLNLGTASSGLPCAQEVVSSADMEQILQAGWMALAKRIVANTVDVGSNFAEEARKIHYGEVKARGIRGQASRAQTDSLIEEGIAVMPLLMPEALKGQLQ